MKDGIKHVWFDFAGTLYKETYEFHVLHDRLRYQTYAKLKGLDNMEAAQHEFQELLSKYGSNSAAFRSLGQPADFWNQKLDDLDYGSVLKPDPVVSQTLAKLKEVVPVSLFTNFVKYRVLHLLNILEIPPDYFTYILSGDEVTERKPALEGFHKLIEESKISPHQILYIGDRVDVDIKPAKLVGIKTCIIYSKSSEADLCLDSFEDILNIIK